MDNIKNGYDFLAKNKFDDAINAFSNAVSANSKDIEAHFGLSQAYYFLYKETNINSYKNTAKDHANICLNLNPQHPQFYAAKSFLSLISNDNSSKTNTNTTKNLVEKYAQTTYDKSHQKEENLLPNAQKDVSQNLNQGNATNDATTSAISKFWAAGCFASYAIIAHKSAIDVAHHTIYTCVEAKTGNILWEKSSGENLLFNVENQNDEKNNNKKNIFNISNKWELNGRSRYGDLIVFYINKPTPSLVIIDVKTGKITLEKSNLF